jgi:hypothetical protein
MNSVHACVTTRMCSGSGSWSIRSPRSSRCCITQRVPGARIQVAAHTVIHELYGRLASGCLPVFTSDGLNHYFYALTAHFGQWVAGVGRRARRWQVAAGLLYGQVQRTYRRRKLVRVTHVMRWGTRAALKTALQTLGLSGRLNTAFVERVNLTIRQSVAALARRTWATVQDAPHLLVHLASTGHSERWGVSWSQPQLISDGNVKAIDPFVAIDRAGNAHFIWAEQRCGRPIYNAFYRVRGPDGSLSPTIALRPDCDVMERSGRLALTNDGKVHAVFMYEDDLYYARLEGERWLNRNISETPGTNTYNPTLATDGTGLYVAWDDAVNGHDIRFRRSIDGSENCQTLCRCLTHQILPRILRRPTRLPESGCISPGATRTASHICRAGSGIASSILPAE